MREHKYRYYITLHYITLNKPVPSVNTSDRNHTQQSPLRILQTLFTSVKWNNPRSMCNYWQTSIHV